METRLLSH